MLIRPSLTSLAPPRVARQAPLAARVEVDGQAEKISFTETVVKSTVTGASLGTVGGGFLGQGAMLASGGYLGWRLGQSLGGSDLGGAVGAVVGAGAALLLERKMPVGETLGSVGGFVTGGLVGGIAGSVIGGVQAVANSNLFK